MPYRPALKCPSSAFLEEVERTFSIVWPEAFRTFCRVHAGASLNDRYPGLRGRFICDLTSLEETNRLIGEGSWGDLEKAVGRKRQPKDGRRIYLDVLPFYIFKKDVFGFQTGEPGSDKVVMWAVHTIVHEYSTFEDWLSEEARSKKDQR